MFNKKLDGRTIQEWRNTAITALDMAETLTDAVESTQVIAAQREEYHNKYHQLNDAVLPYCEDIATLSKLKSQGITLDQMIQDLNIQVD
ncbi:hypothetical protein L4C54_03750 [Vibrio lamellibrachiae]|uniref:hypothetical protein n=1 Tax=Vibrio lamellibrachiae TaxID=2910253 RepID=UPI003D099C90